MSETATPRPVIAPPPNTITIYDLNPVDIITTILVGFGLMTLFFVTFTMTKGAPISDK